MMQIIPVIDVKNGLVVRAIKGERAAYRPIATPLSKSSYPADVVEGYLRVFPFQTIYVADLNAIEHNGNNRVLIDALTQTFPHLRFWIDAGSSSQEMGVKGPSSPNVDVILGTENLSSLRVLQRFAEESRALLSLDFRDERLIGPAELLERSDLWPKRVIVMTMTRIGADRGPDVETVANIKTRANGREVFAAGGVRDARDLEGLAEIGAAGTLVASALHSGALTAADIWRLAKKYEGAVRAGSLL